MTDGWIIRSEDHSLRKCWTKADLKNDQSERKSDEASGFMSDDAFLHPTFHTLASGKNTFHTLTSVNLTVLFVFFRALEA